MSVSAEHTFRSVEDILSSRRVLAVLDFAAVQTNPPRMGDPRHVVTGLPWLAGCGVREVWRSSTPVTWGWNGPIGWALDDDVMFGAITVDVSPPRELEAVVYSAWRRLLQFSIEKGFPHLVRAWNHIPRINEGKGDAQRYKLFCAGRARAYEAQGYESSRFPASSAVGNMGDTLVMYLLACAEPGKHYENPCQISAYSYPRRYGPQSPSFARATAKVWPRTSQLYVSGTASILGHQSCCRGDIDGQLMVTFANIDRLLQTVDELGASSRPDRLRVYVRNQDDLERIRAAAVQYAPEASAVYLRADICRSELAVEIEGLRQRILG